MTVEPVRKERDRPVRTDVLLLGHTGLALQDAGGFGEQPDADHEQHGTDRDREAELPPGLAAGVDRSEEHTSELQSLMRTSYDVLCLKKKTKDDTKYTRTKKIKKE